MASQPSPQVNPETGEESSENLITSSASNPTIPVNKSAGAIVSGEPTEPIHIESAAPKLQSTFAQLPKGEEESSKSLITSGYSNPTTPVNESSPAIIPGEPTEPLHTESTAPKLQSTFAQFRLTWLLILGTACWIGFTVFFAYNATLNDPLSKKLISPKASRTILILTALSHVTVHLLQAVASAVFEAVRWALAGSNRGVSSFSFNVLSRATGTLGVLYLLFFNSKTGKIRPFLSPHRSWSLIRYISF